MRRMMFLLMLLACVLATASPALACDPQPTEQVMDCNDLGWRYQYGFQLQGTRNGTYHFTSSDGRMVGGAPQDPNQSLTIAHSDQRSFDWSSTLGIDAVVVFAGPTPSIYYLNETTQGQNYRGAKQTRRTTYAISKVLFCYDYELAVDTQAQGGGGSGASWTLEKTVNLAQQAKFIGETAVFDYTVAVQKSGTGGSGVENEVSGSVTITNPTPLPAKIQAVYAYFPGTRSRLALKDCAGTKLPLRLSPGQTVVCDAAATLSSQVQDLYKVSVVTAGAVGGGKAEGRIVWSDSGGGTGPGTVTVTDSNAAFGGPYTVSAGQTWTYQVSLDCPSDPGAYQDGLATVSLENTAALTETGQTASQSVQLTCYAPVVSSTSGTRLERQYFWEITKTSPVTKLVFYKPSVVNVPYAVGVSVTAAEDRNFQVAGSVTVDNPNPNAAMSITLSDEILPGVAVDFVECPNPVLVPAGGSVSCNYQVGLENKAPGTNVSQVVFNGVTFTSTAAYDFDSAVITPVDGCVLVTDDALPGSLGSVCADQAPGSFDYSLKLGPFESTICNEHTSFLNTAFFVTNDTQSEGFANWEVEIVIKCEAGTNCTFTPAYWAAHANPGDPANYKPTWDLIQPAGASSPFFTTGLTWLETLQADESASVYLVLAQQYIAADLNLLYGASATSQFQATVAHAADLLSTYAADPGSISAAVQADFTQTADLLSMFNNGLTGPGVCPECDE